MSLTRTTRAATDAERAVMREWITPRRRGLVQVAASERREVCVVALVAVLGSAVPFAFARSPRDLLFFAGAMGVIAAFFLGLALRVRSRASKREREGLAALAAEEAALPTAVEELVFTARRIVTALDGASEDYPTWWLVEQEEGWLAFHGGSWSCDQELPARACVTLVQTSHGRVLSILGSGNAVPLERRADHETWTAPEDAGDANPLRLTEAPVLQRA